MTPNADYGTCSCGHPERPRINHRKRIPCWTYIGDKRYVINEDGEPVPPNDGSERTP